MSILVDFQRHLAEWFAQAVPAAPVPARAHGAAAKPGADDTQRKSIHDVTLEQLGIAHWSCHTHF
jgi:hypothetical protein